LEQDQIKSNQVKEGKSVNHGSSVK